MERPLNIGRPYEDYHTFKLVLLGDSGVGKSNIVKRLLKEGFNEGSKSTIGIEFRSLVIRYNNENIKMQIWDTAGEEKYNSISSAYYRNASVAFIIYDISNSHSYNNIEYWYNKIKDIENISIYLIANKMDLLIEDSDDLDIPFMKYFKVSAKNNYGLNELLEEVSAELHRKIKQEEIEIINLVPKKKSCCF